MAIYFDLIFDKLTWLNDPSILINTTDDPTLITNHDHPAGVDTIIVVG